MWRMLAVALVLAFTGQGEIGRGLDAVSGQSPTAETVLALARAALGTSRVQVRTLEFEVQKKLGAAGPSMATYSLELPGQFLRVESDLVLPGRVYRGFNESQMIARREGGEDAVIRPEFRQKMYARIKADATWLSVAFLLAADTPIPLQYAYVARAESPDGAADAIDAKGADGFAARLFIDTDTRRLVMLSHQVPAPGKVVQHRDGERVTATVEKPAGGEDTIEERWYLSDFIAADGVFLPRRISVTRDGREVQQWEIRRVTINPRFPKDKFRVK